MACFTQFAVRTNLQGRGLGTQVMNFIENRAAELGVEYLALDTSERAFDLIEMYKKRGYLEVAKHSWDFTNYKSVVLSKKLAT